MANKRIVGVASAVVVLAVAGVFGVRMVGHAGGEEGATAGGCGGVQPGVTQSAIQSGSGTGQPIPQHPFGVQVSATDPQYKPYVDASLLGLTQELETSHLTAANLKPQTMWDDGRGVIHVLFAQTVNGIPVVGGEALVTMHGDQTVQAKKAQFVDVSRLEAPKVTQERALDLATHSVQCSTCTSLCEQCIAEAPKLGPLAWQPKDGGFVYRVSASGNGKTGAATNRVCFVDPATAIAECPDSQMMVTAHPATSLDPMEIRPAGNPAQIGVRVPPGPEWGPGGRPLGIKPAQNVGLQPASPAIAEPDPKSP